MKTKRHETTAAVIAALKAEEKRLESELASVQKALAIFEEETVTKTKRTGKKPGPKKGATRKATAEVNKTAKASMPKQAKSESKKETPAGNGALSKKERAAMLRGDTPLRPAGKE